MSLNSTAFCKDALHITEEQEYPEKNPREKTSREDRVRIQNSRLVTEFLDIRS